MTNSSNTTPEQNALITRLAAHVDADPRILSAWLEGSHGRGDADPYADTDLHVLLTADDLATIADDVTAWLAPVATFAYSKRVFGQLYHLITGDGARIDVMLHEGDTATIYRPHTRILKGSDRLSDGPPPTVDAARTMPADVREFWRVVLLLPVALGRGELLRAWQGGIGFQVNTLINLLVRGRGNPQALGAKKLNLQIAPEDRARLESLLALPTFDAENTARVTLSLAALMREIGPACCQAIGDTYPSEWEAVVIAHLQQTLPAQGMETVLTETLGPLPSSKDQQ